MSNTYFIRVVLDPTGVLRGLRNITGAMDKLDNKVRDSINLFRTFFALQQVGQALGGIIKLGDAYADLETKVRMASGKNDVLSQSMDKVFKASNRARSDVRVFASSVQAMAGATANMNLGFGASVRMAETLAKQLRLGGATMAEQKSVQLQYGQAMRKGKLDSDEFRSIMENSLPVQQALAKELGISTDQLSKFSKAGLITRQVMVGALIKSADEVDKKFAMMSMRVSDAWTVLTNSAIKFAGSLKLNELLAPMLLFLADNFDAIARAAAIAASMIGTFFVRQGIFAAIGGLMKLHAFLLVNPWTAFAMGIVGVVVAIRMFARDAKIAGSGMATVADLFQAAWNRMGQAAETVRYMIGNAISAVADIFGELVEIADLSFADILVFFAAMGDGIIKVAVFLKDAVVTIFGGLSATIASGFIQGINKIIDAANDLDVRARKIKGLVTGDAFDMKYETNASGNVIPPSKGELSGTRISTGVQMINGVPVPVFDRGTTGGPQFAPYRDPSGNRVESSAAFDFRGTSPRYNQADAEEEARRRGFPKEVFDIAQGRGITLNEAVRIAEQGLGNSNVNYQPRISKVENPYEGAWAATNQMADEAFKKLFSSDAGPLQRVVEGVLADAEDIARNRKPDDRRGLLEPGKAADPAQTAAEKAAAAKAERERQQSLKAYEALRSSISGVYAAELELANAQETLDNAFLHGQSSLEVNNEIMMRKRAALADQLDPYQALLREMSKEIIAAENLNGAWNTNAKIMGDVARLRKEGAEITTEQLLHMKTQADLLQGLSDRQSRQTDYLGKAGYVSPDEQRARALVQARDMYGEGDLFNAKAAQINRMTFAPIFEDKAAQYARALADVRNVADELNLSMAQTKLLIAEVNKEFEVGRDKTNSFREIGIGLKEGMHQVFVDLSDMAGGAAKLVQDAFSLMTDAIVRFVSTGEISFAQLFTSMIAMMSRLATQGMFFELMKLIGYSAGAALGGGGGGGIGNGLLEPTFAADGGLYRVAGPGGIDKVPVPMMLTDGEHLRVYPRGEDPGGGTVRRGGGGMMPPVVMVVRDEKEAALAVAQSPRGQAVQMKNLAQNPAHLRTLQAGRSRA